ncbi:MAG TPA: DUF4838 domain-containing protein [Phycisphaerae bacterium]|nr:DUF4838 domain-containing protein [Phycisphaerae bacterium]HDZ42308.1 DUF4838 domain-containing protein [Phycisphaerae bacterium]
MLAITWLGIGSAGAWFVIAAVWLIVMEYVRGRPSTSSRASVILKCVVPLVTIALGLIGVWILGQSGTTNGQTGVATVFIAETHRYRPASLNGNHPALSVKAGRHMIETTSRNELWESNIPKPLFCIAANGKTDYRIVVPSEPTSTERIAAAELAKYLELISGIEFEVVDDASPQTDAEIVLGFGSRTDTLLPGYDYSELGHDGFIIKTIGTKLILAGGKKRGTMYAVYSFLEDYLGCRWWTPQEELVPARQVIEILPIDRKDIPTFISRDTLCISNREGGNNWPIKHKLNGTGTAVTDDQGGKVRIYPGGHSFSALIDPKEHFDQHPEWFAMIDGQRQPYQLCTSNEEVIRKCIETVKRWIVENPDIDIFSVSQDDGPGFCHCPDCMAIYVEEGMLYRPNPMGGQLRLANRIAEAIEEEYPNKLIHMLAYFFTVNPPTKTKPHKNILVRLCDYESCMSHPLVDCAYPVAAENTFPRRFVSLVRRWGELSDRVFVWDYLTNFHNYLQPLPNFHVMQKDVQFFAENHVVGIYMQSVYGAGAKGGFQDMRNYLSAKLMWDPYYDFERSMDEFLAFYYGTSAAPLLKQWIKFMEMHVTENNFHYGMYFTPNGRMFTKEFLDTGESLISQAERLAENETFRQRIHYELLAITYVRLQRMPFDAPNRQERIDAFFKEMESYGVNCLNEGVPLETVRNSMETGQFIDDDPFWKYDP